MPAIKKTISNGARSVLKDLFPTGSNETFNLFTDFINKKIPSLFSSVNFQKFFSQRSNNASDLLSPHFDFLNEIFSPYKKSVSQKSRFINNSEDVFEYLQDCLDDYFSEASDETEISFNAEKLYQNLAAKFGGIGSWDLSPYYFETGLNQFLEKLNENASSYGKIYRGVNFQYGVQRIREQLRSLLKQKPLVAQTMFCADVIYLLSERFNQNIDHTELMNGINYYKEFISENIFNEVINSIEGLTTSSAFDEKPKNKIQIKQQVKALFGFLTPILQYAENELDVLEEEENNETDIATEEDESIEEVEEITTESEFEKQNRKSQYSSRQTISVSWKKTIVIGVSFISAVAADEIKALDTETLVNFDNTQGTQGFPAIVAAPGGAVVGWHSLDAGSSYNIHMQMFNLDTDPVNSNYLVSEDGSALAGVQWAPVFAIYEHNLLTTWLDTVSGVSQLYGRWFEVFINSSSITPLSNHFLIGNDSFVDQLEQAVVCAPPGNCAAVWSQGNGVEGRVLDANTRTFVTNAFPVSSGNEPQSAPAVAATPAGDFAAVFQKFISNNFDIYRQYFNSTGAFLGGQWRVNQYLTSGQTNPAITYMGADSLIAWQSWDGAAWKIVVRQNQDNEFFVHPTGDSQEEPRVVELDNNEGVVTFRERNGTDPHRMMLQPINNAGPHGPAVQINEGVEDTSQPRVTTLENGEVQLSYTKIEGDTNVYTKQPILPSSSSQSGSRSGSSSGSGSLNSQGSSNLPTDSSNSDSSNELSSSSRDSQSSESHPQSSENTASSSSEGSNATRVLIGILAAAGLCITVGGATVYKCARGRNLERERKEINPFAAALRRELRLAGVDNFSEGKGQAFCEAVNALKGQIDASNSGGKSVDSMIAGELDTLARDVGRVIKNNALSVELKPVYQGYKNVLNTTLLKNAVITIAQSVSGQEDKFVGDENDSHEAVNLMEM